MNTSWQFCFSTMYIGESEGLFETLNCGQPLGLRCGRNLRDSGDHADDISVPNHRGSKERKQGYPVALADVECNSASSRDVMWAKPLSISDPHLPVDMALGIHPINFFF